MTAEGGRLRILDLFCGAGGASVGFKQAFPDAEITGVDIAFQKNYPFTFIRADAMTFPLDGFDFIHASPPCQAYSVTRHLPWLKHKEHPRLIAPIRERLIAAGVPYVIENVEGAKRDGEISGGWLCGGMFGKRFYRHRVFESSFLWLQPAHAKHRGVIGPGRMFGSRGREGITGWQRRVAEGGSGVAVGHAAGARVAGAEMGIDWMTRDELSQAIPPCYSRYLAQFIPLRAEVAA